MKKPRSLGAFLLRYDDFFLGTFLPFLRALESPIAIACLRLFTLPPRPFGPLRALPFLYRFISDSTSRPELFEYFRLVAMRCLLRTRPLRLGRFPITPAQ